MFRVAPTGFRHDSLCMSGDSEDLKCNIWDNSDCVGTPYCPPRCPRFTDKEEEALIARPYRSEDLEPLVDMYEDLDSYSRTMGLPPAGRPQIENWLVNLMDRGWGLIALRGERIVGHVAATPEQSATPEIVIFVHQDVRDRGIGTELMKQLLAYAADKDHAGLSLEVSSGKERAISVYENIGFDVVESTLRELQMEISLQKSIAERVQRPPSERS